MNKTFLQVTPGRLRRGKKQSSWSVMSTTKKTHVGFGNSSKEGSRKPSRRRCHFSSDMKDSWVSLVNLKVSMLWEVVRGMWSLKTLQHGISVVKGMGAMGAGFEHNVFEHTVTLVVKEHPR